MAKIYTFFNVLSNFFKKNVEPFIEYNYINKPPDLGSSTSFIEFESEKYNSGDIVNLPRTYFIGQQFPVNRHIYVYEGFTSNDVTITQNTFKMPEKPVTIDVNFKNMDIDNSYGHSSDSNGEYFRINSVQFVDINTGLPYYLKEWDIDCSIVDYKANSKKVLLSEEDNFPYEVSVSAYSYVGPYFMKINTVYKGTSRIIPKRTYRFYFINGEVDIYVIT